MTRDWIGGLTTLTRWVLHHSVKLDCSLCLPSETGGEGSVGDVGGGVPQVSAHVDTCQHPCHSGEEHPQSSEPAVAVKVRGEQVLFKVT